MAVKFRPPGEAPASINSAPHKSKAPQIAIKPGLDHRPFSEDEILEAFNTFDLNKKNFVGAREIRHILNLIGEDCTDEEIDEMIRMCDNDGDGQVTFDEFRRMMTQEAPPLPPALPAHLKPKPRGKAHEAARAGTMLFEGSQAKMDIAIDTGNKQFRAATVDSLIKKLTGGVDKIKPNHIKKVYKRFQEIDVDGSGSIDREEFAAALEITDETIANRMFEVFDMDGSNSIELKEFIVVLSRYTSGTSKSEKLNFAFMMFDEDSSGFIERDELLMMLGATFKVEGYSQEELEEKADQVFDTLGLPHDGAISYQEFLKLAEDRRGLIYPIEETQHALGNSVSINKLFEEAGAG